jgi:hypothetical protein
MIKGRIKELQRLDTEAILSKVDDYNIIRYYLGQDFNFKKDFHSPFRGKGSRPNLRFFEGDAGGGRIMFKDFATGQAGDCFRFVMFLHGCNFFEALEKIDEDFGLGIKAHKSPVFKVQLKKKPDSIHKQARLVQVLPREFTKEDLEYWSRYEITQAELERKNVYSVDKLYMNKQLLPSKKDELRFAYQFDQYIKVYAPLSKEYKWISSCPNDFISGFDDIKYKIFKGIQSKKLIISKSVKDEIVLSKFFKDVCSTQNESPGAINYDDMGWILRGYNPEDVYIAYDNDETGVNASTYFTEGYRFNYVNVPKIFRREGIKDWADLVMYKGLDTMENYLKIKKLI